MALEVQFLVPLEENKSWIASDAESVLSTKFLNRKLPSPVVECSEADSEGNVEFKAIGSSQISKPITSIDHRLNLLHLTIEIIARSPTFYHFLGLK